MVFSFLKIIAWVMVACFATSCALFILLKVYDYLTPKIDEQEELKKGNIAVAIVLASLILGFSFVVGMILQPDGVSPVNYRQVYTEKQSGSVIPTQTASPSIVSE